MDNQQAYVAELNYLRSILAKDGEEETLKYCANIITCLRSALNDKVTQTLKQGGN
jgi:hypothetical protein